ncbi:hypothetical protein OEZ86_000803 [Tetradesmus obliquus]|nr:hypothetical protein OEZ86_000803 [Tetradesmus obliquus]
MTQELHFTPEVYGLASGFFFLPYCLLQVPANYVCMALGVQRWFTCIQIMFGLTAASFAAVRHPWQLFLLRLLLGVAEAGSFPGVWYAISLWFPPDRIAFPYSLMATSVAVSQTIAAPIAAALLKMDGLLGLSGWQWVFIGEGIPSVLLGLCLPWLLPNGPHALDTTVSSWLAPHEVQLLQADHAAKVSDLRSPSSHDTSCQAAKEGAGHPASAMPGSAMPHKLQLLVHVVRVWQVWYLAFCNILKDVGNLGLMMWLPVMWGGK